jgi:hypothetical protein
MLGHLVTYLFTDVSEVCTASIIKAMMEVLCTSETLANFNVTPQLYIPEDSKLCARCCEIMKSHKLT